ncbi:MAG TPA: rhomboid family intramembrane serine protease [Saprospiraceae bacterium]|nr:rhomboid family intramembrane serine protease [Saprospiraceae bacterium]
MLNRLTDVVKHLLIINVIAYIITLPNHSLFGYDLAVHYPMSPLFHPYQLVTHMFMHGSPMHLFFNMYGLVLLGPPLEARLGSSRFLLFYLISGFGALLLHFGVSYYQLSALSHSIDAETLTEIYDNGAQLVAGGQNYSNPVLGRFNEMLNGGMLGASGAIFGVLAGFGTMFPRVQLQLLFPPITLTARWFVLIYAGIELYLGLNGVQQGVAHFAHIGGALFGFLLLQYWRRTTIL